MEQSEGHGRFDFRKVGSADGSIIGTIIGTIIASHMSWKLMAEPNHVWPGIGIHIIDILHPPGISISQHIDRQKYAVAHRPATNATTLTARNRAGSGVSFRCITFSRLADVFTGL
jgi:hypothetical protein